jgi:two-component system sensor histidine kinase MprB
MEEFSTLVADLDALARREASDQPLDHIDVQGVVTSAVRRAQRRAGGVRIDTHFDRPGQIMGEGALLERAVVNVIDNAVKWSPEGGKVDVRVTGQLVEVADHGPGIAPEDVPFVFDRFWRAPNARGMPGSGLGLAIVRQAVDAHGGSVTIDPNPGGGTRVRIDLNPSTAAS